LGSRALRTTCATSVGPQRTRRAPEPRTLSFAECGRPDRRLRGVRAAGFSAFRGVRAAGLAAGGWFVVLVAARGIRNAAAELEVERGTGQQDGGGERHGRGDFILARH